MKQSKKGFALVSAIVISVVLFILTAGLITAAMMSMNMTAKNIDQRQAYLNAKSALGFAESYYIDQLLLPDSDEYLAFASENGIPTPSYICVYVVRVRETPNAA